MSTTTLGLAPQLRAYLDEHGLREHASLRALRAESDRLADGGMRSAAEQAQLLAFLVELTGARRVLEIGCFTGYTTLAMALALPPDGRVVTLDVNDDWAAIGRRRWEEAGVAARIELRLGLAIDGLSRLEAERAVFDLAYIDADKKTYPDYYEAALRLVRPGGLIALDNVLQRGEVADAINDRKQVATLRRLNELIHADRRVSMVLLPIGDGLTLARKR